MNIAISVTENEIKQLETEYIFDFSDETTPPKNFSILDTFDRRLFNKNKALVFSGGRYRFIAKNATPFNFRCKRPPIFSTDIKDRSLMKLLQDIIDIRCLTETITGTFSTKDVNVTNSDGKTVAKGHMTQYIVSDKEFSLMNISCLRRYESDLTKIKKSIKELDHPLNELGFFDQIVRYFTKNIDLYSNKTITALEPHAPIETSVVKLLKHQLDIMLANEPYIINAPDTEFLHDFRVAVRRTRSAISQMKDIFTDEVLTEFKTGFSEIGNATNEIRDLDVYTLNMDSYRSMLPERLRQDLNSFQRLLKTKHRQAEKILDTFLRSERYLEFMDSWRKFLNETYSSSLGKEAGAETISVASNSIYRLYKKILKKSHLLTKDSKPQLMHSIRIECKKLRYQMEFYRSLFPAEMMNSAVTELKKLQDCLGEYNDSEVQTDMIFRFVEEMSVGKNHDPRSSLAMGALIESLDSKRLKHIEEFEGVFAHFLRAENRKKFEKLFNTHQETSNSL